MFRTRLSAISGCFAAFYCVVACQSAAAVSVTRARIVVDAPDPGRPAITADITFAEKSTKPQTSIRLFLAREVTIESAVSEGQSVTLASAPEPGTSLRTWNLKLPVPLTSTKTRAVSLQLRIDAGNPALRIDSQGGLLLAGSGWFPMLDPRSDLAVPHSTTFALPEGFVGLACGNAPSGGAPWTSTSPGRPFVAWGRFAVTPETHGTNEIQLWRRTGEPGNSRAVDLAVSCWNALEAGLGPACGSGPLRLVEEGVGVLAGGQRTLFWNEARFAGDPDSFETRDAARELAVALASSFWNDCLSFSGDDAGWLARAIPEYLGDVSYLASLKSENQDAIEADLLNVRREIFLGARTKDRALRGLVPLSAGATDVLRGRGALTIHQLGEACPSRSHWISFLEDVRVHAKGGEVARKAFFADLQIRVPNQHTFVPPYLDGTDLPDFRLLSYKQAQGTEKDRLRVEVDNAGPVAGSVDVRIETPKGEKIRETRLTIPPGEKRAVLMKDERRTGIIRVDPRRTTLQSDYAEETAKLSAGVVASAAIIPSYEVEGEYHNAHKVTGFNLQLDGVSITEFDGVLVPFRTFHGPSGAVLLGSGRVRIAPGPPQAKEWTAAMGRDALTFSGINFWVRFPLAAWSTIEPQLGPIVSEDERPEVMEDGRPVVLHSMPTGFVEESRFQVPPPGSSLITFTAEGGQLRGFFRKPLPDGRISVRFWDQLSGVTLWEDTRTP